jgi:hypothetical protein
VGSEFGSHPQEGSILTVQAQTEAAGSGEQLQLGISTSVGQPQVSGSAGHCDMEIVDVVDTGMKNWVPVVDRATVRGVNT